MADTLNTGTTFSPELVTELMNKVKGYSTLAKLSAQTPIPFNGSQQFVFNLEGNAQIVGEGETKKPGKATIETKVIRPLKFVYQARITDEFKYCSEAKQVDYLQAFSDGFAKKIAVAFDLAAIHGLEPKSLTDASFKTTNSIDGLVTAVEFNAKTQFDDQIDSIVQTVVANDYDVTGLALSPAAGQALAQVKVNGVVQYPEFRFGQNPDAFYGMASDVNKTLATKGATSENDYAIAGDFQNAFKWGYSEEIPLEVIEYGDPDQTGRDLKANNEVLLRAESFIGWGVLDAKAFARIKAPAE
ncbi:phage major capsid family protein [Ligilactobacillus sp.]|uniref:phage major capsid family protein n=1 Tax=Ligilactobacillus sp. TaxID=2767921 RepID=UPI002FE1984D